MFTHFSARQAGYLLGITLLIFSLFSCGQDAKKAAIFYTVQQGDLPIYVTATGELDAKKSIKIRGPQGMRAAGIYETTLSDIVPEGTILKEGEFVATLDRTELANKISTIQTELDKIQTQLDQAVIDTAIELRSIRDDLVNTQFSLREKRLQADLNKYEAQAIIRQTQLDLERSERDFQQLQQRYSLKQEQAEAKIKEILTLQKQNQNQMDILVALSKEFSIYAPEDGMLIYARSWQGKVEPGSRITAWNPVVAELPDLTDMISKTYVNEVDISKIRKGQDVVVKLDAFADREYNGTVIKVANIGEQVRGYDTKVFEVIVQMNTVDSIMRPAMTSSNEIWVDTYADVLSVPLEALYSDSLTYVYKKDNGRLVKQEVIPSAAGPNHIVISYGLQAGDEVLLSLPDEEETDVPFYPVDPAIKESIRQQQAKELAEREAAAKKKEEAAKDIDLPSNSGGGGDFMIVID